MAATVQVVPQWKNGSQNGNGGNRQVGNGGNGLVMAGCLAL